MNLKTVLVNTWGKSHVLEASGVKECFLFGFFGDSEILGNDAASGL
jgi:hypothetical protein